MNAKSRNELYVTALQRAGLRLTAQRQAVCAYLAATASHPTASQVYADLLPAHPDISRATVYNTLNTLQQLGAIVELSFGSDHTHYETNPEPHVNLICLRCHQIVDYWGSIELAALGDRVLEEVDFHTAAARIDLVGFCSECRALKRAEIREQLRVGNKDEGNE